MPPGRGRGRGNGHASSSRRQKNGPPPDTLDGPLRNRDYIFQQFGHGVTIKEQWEENPKAPLANFLGGGAGGATNVGEGGDIFKVEEGVLNGQRLFR